MSVSAPSPLLAAASQGDVTQVRQIIWERRAELLRALEAAASRGHLRLVQFLAAFDLQGESDAVDQAALQGHTAVVEYLLIFHKGSQRHFRRSTLQTLATRGDLAMLQIFLRATPNSQQDHYRQIVLEAARQANQWPIIAALQKGPKTDRDTKGIKDKPHKPP